MDSPHSALFYAFAAPAIVGAVVAAWARSREMAGLGLLLVALAVALLLADLSAGFAGLLVFVLLAGASALSLAVPTTAEPPPRRAHNMGAVVAALLFAALAYAAYRGVYHPGEYPGGTFNSAALGRLLLGRDALALIAVGAAAFVGIAHLPGGRRASRR